MIISLEALPYINHPELNKIDLDGNRIKILNTQIIAPKLTYIHMAMNDIEMVHIPRWSKLPSLKSVDFRGNLITGISEDVYSSFYVFFNVSLVFCY
jgi:Leucine-rich repeat (LRR) protein